MPTKILEDSDFIALHKPNGVSTHRPSEDHLGFVEWTENQLGLKLKVVHRLDKETSGVLVFAKSQEAAGQLTELFSQRKVEKEYLLLSHKKAEFDHFVVYEDEKAKGTLLKECPWQEGSTDFKAFTEFVRVPSEGLHYVYKALPRTGKTHQIRKHAVHARIPILGDQEYGGYDYPRLMLHARSLKFKMGDKVYHLQAEPSRLFDSMDLGMSLLCWIDAFERREVLWPEAMNEEQALRLFHKQSAPLRGDKVAGKIILGWWEKQAPTESQQQEIKQLMNLLEFENWIFQWRPGAQEDHSTDLLLASDNFDSQPWVFRENNCKMMAHLDRGQNFGLFLDQRERRQWVQDHSDGKSVLNLFAFTCGFSLRAALGGARKVVSVDLFQKYLKWGKENFQANGLDPDNEAFEFRAMDSIEYLRWAVKKGFRFDTIVCDPPSFSRNKKKKSVFRVEKDFPELIHLCHELLKPGGHLLFSNNYEKWDHRRWKRELEGLETSSWSSILSSPSQWDYEWQKQDANLKAFFMVKA